MPCLRSRVCLLLDAFRWVDIIPIWPKNTSDLDPSVDRWLLFMLYTMSDTCKRILWDSTRESSRTEKQENCFQFLFEMFKRHYLRTLFPTFTEQNIYDFSLPRKIPVEGRRINHAVLSFASVTIPESVRLESDRSRKPQVFLCRTAFVIWLLPFLNEVQVRDRTL